MGKKSRRTRSQESNTGPKQNPGPSFSQVPQILHVVQTLAASGRVPREAVFYAVHHLLDLEKNHASDPGYHALAQGRVAESDIHRFIQTTLQIMTSHHQHLANSTKGAKAEGEGWAGASVILVIW